MTFPIYAFPNVQKDFHDICCTTYTKNRSTFVHIYDINSQI